MNTEVRTRLCLPRALFLMSLGDSNEKDAMGINECMKYLEDLNIDLESAAILVPMEIMRVPTMGRVTREGFVNGWKSVG